MVPAVLGGRVGLLDCVVGGVEFVRFRLRVCGVTLASITFDAGSAPIAEEEPEGITGGSALYTERDMNPPDPSNEEPWYGDRFGFG